MLSQLPPAEWVEYCKQAKYFGYDRNVHVNVSWHDILSGKPIICPIDRQKDGVAEIETHKEPGSSKKESTPSSSGRQKPHVPCKTCDQVQVARAFTIRLPGLGMESEDSNIKGDLNVKVRLDP